MEFSHWFDTMVTTYFPPNVATREVHSDHRIGIRPSDADSFHPGGVNWGFCDGSVRFIKNSISSWAFGATVIYSISNILGNRGWWYQFGSCRCDLHQLHLRRPRQAVTQQGIYQSSLDAESGGEVISSDQY